MTYTLLLLQLVLLCILFYSIHKYMETNKKLLSLQNSKKEEDTLLNHISYKGVTYRELSVISGIPRKKLYLKIFYLVKKNKVAIRIQAKGPRKIYKL